MRRFFSWEKEAFEQNTIYVFFPPLRTFCRMSSPRATSTKSRLMVTRTITTDDESRKEAAVELETRLIAHAREKGWEVDSAELLDLGIESTFLSGRFSIGLEERLEDGVRARLNQKEGPLVWNVEDAFDEIVLKYLRSDPHAILLKSISLVFDGGREVEKLRMDFWCHDAEADTFDVPDYPKGGGCTLCSVL